MSGRAGTYATALRLAIAGVLLWSCSSDTHTPTATDTSELRAPLSRHHGDHGDGGTPDAAAYLDTNPTITDFVLYAERSVKLGRDDRVRGGDVGVATLAMQSFGTQLIVGEHSFVDSEQDLLAPSIQLDAHSLVGDVETSSLTNNGGRLLLQAPFPTSMPPVPIALASSPGTSNVTVDRWQFQKLAPGAYAALTVNGSLLLEPGIFYFSAVTLGDGARVLALPGGADVRIAGSLATGNGSRLSPLEPEDGWYDGWGPNPHCQRQPASQLSISVSGYDGPGGTPPAVSLGEGTGVDALLFAPRGTLSLKARTSATGAYAALDITIDDLATVAYESGFQTNGAGQEGSQQLSGYISPAMAAAPLVGPVPPDTTIQFAIGLPLRNEGALQAAIAHLYEPSSPTYHQYLSPGSFAAAYGPLPSVTGPFVSFLSTNGLAETTYTNNQLFDVSGPASVVQSTFFVNLNYYQRPDGSVFYAPDREPSIELDAAVVPIARIDGLDDFVVVKPAAGSGPVPQPPGQVQHSTGVNLYMGSDLRNAYLPGVAVTGANETVAIVALDSYVDTDVTKYESCPDCNPPPSNWAPNVPVKIVPLDGLVLPPPAPATNETILDIDMVIAMAPGVAEIDVYEAPYTLAHTKQVNDILALIANPFGERLANQISCSWLNFGGYNTTVSMYQFAMQGQSFFMGAGDNGSYYDNGVATPIVEGESAYMTIVGGTQLTTAADKSWSSERVWNDAVPTLRGNLGATGGGSLLSAVDDFYGSVPVPDYQVPIAGQIMQAGGNPSWRAIPDVAMTATDLGIYLNGELNFASGTSAAGPLWAGFAALINEKAFGQGAMPLGFANPALYSAAQSSQYSNLFHDVTTGTNSQVSSGHYLATANYDLTTGWGTPTGNLIGYLACPSYCGNTSDTCEDLDTDPNNCGSCGNSCGIAGQCFAGQCGQVTVGMTAAASGLEICIYAIGFTPGDFVHVVFSGAPGGFGGRDGVVDANGQWAYFDEVPYDTACSSTEASGSVTVTEVDPNQPVQYPTAVVPASYFCSQGAGQPNIGPGAPGPTQCLAPDGTSGLFFGQ